MNAAKLTTVLILFLTINIRNVGSDACICRRPNHTEHCIIRGCSNGTNSQCNTGTDYDGRYAAISIGTFTRGSFSGCNCPGNPVNIEYNAVYSIIVDFTIRMYNYTNCTTFGLNSRDGSGKLSANANDAISCCNYCCGRHDSYI